MKLKIIINVMKILKAIKVNYNFGYLNANFDILYQPIIE